MAKGLFCVTLAACLLFQASAQLPLRGNLLGGSRSSGGSANGSAIGSVSVNDSDSGALNGIGSLTGGLGENLSALINKPNAAIANIPINAAIGPNSPLNNLNKAVVNLQNTKSLTTTAGKCISSGTDFANKTGQNVVTQLRSYLRGQRLELSNIVPNFSFYLNRAEKAIENITSSAFGPNSPINKLNKAVVNLQTVIATVTPYSAAIAVKASIKRFQEFINQAKIAASGSINPAVGACISTAQTSFNNIAPQAVNNAVSCSVNIGKDAASLYVQASTFESSLETDLALAATKALAKCSLSILSLNDVIEKCFDAAVSEVENYFNGQINKINKAIATADSLTIEAGRCISAGADFAEKSGQAVVTQLRVCLNGQGVNGS